MSARFDFTAYNADKARNEYDAFYRGEDFVRHRAAEDALVRVLVSRFYITAGARVLDIGCGTGKYTDLFRRHGTRPIGVDLSPEGIARARERFPETEYQQGDALNLPFVPDSFDVVFCSGLSLFNEPRPEPLVALSAYLTSFVRPGGLFIFVKTSSLTDRLSRNNSRFDYSVASFLRILTAVPELQVLDQTATAPHAFLVSGAFAFSPLVSKASALLSRLIRKPVRVYVVLRKKAGAVGADH